MKSYLQIGPCRTLEIHAAPLQQDGRHQVRDEPGVDGSEGPLHRVGILRVWVCAGPGLQQVLGDAEPAGRGEEDVHKQYDGRVEISCRGTKMAPSVTALRTEVKEVNI